LFTDDACKIIADTSRGIPRTVNILCDTALVYGFAAGVGIITAELVVTVIQDKAQFGVLPFDRQPV
jgi:type II secretory pathway predicted ATPase ExeA